MTLTKKSRVRKVFAAMLVVVLLCGAMATTAFAKSFTDKVWQQAVSKMTIDLGYLEPGSNINTSGVKFYAIATSSESGTFDVVLQRQGFLGAWFAVGSAGKGYQGSERKYDTRGDRYVYGAPFLCVWSTNQSGNYRIILENPTAPQETWLSGIEGWAYGTDY